jgi:hypothetical protein
MIEEKLHIWWKVSWKYTTPSILVVSITTHPNPLFSIINHRKIYLIEVHNITYIMQVTAVNNMFIQIYVLCT